MIILILMESKVILFVESEKNDCFYKKKKNCLILILNI